MTVQIFNPLLLLNCNKKIFKRLKNKKIILKNSAPKQIVAIASKTLSLSHYLLYKTS